MSDKLLSSSWYHDVQHFDLEKEKIFGNYWLFACLTSEIPNHKDYYVFECLGKSVIIQNNNGEYKAFKNVCAHRFSRMLNKRRGNGLIMCPYHNWTYDSNGQLIGQKQKKLLNEPEYKICLDSIAIEVVGKFVFINFSSNQKQTLKEYLGKMSEELLIISEALGYYIDELEQQNATNWKFLVENVIETKHCKAVHQETLIKIGICDLPPEENKRLGQHSYFILPPVIDDARLKRARMFDKLLPRKINAQHFKHYLIYPNMTISYTDGISFAIGFINPIDTEHSMYHVKYFKPKLLTERAVSLNLLDEVASDFVEISFKIFEEDRVQLENLQKGVKEARHAGYMYQDEVRLQWFTETYLNSMAE